MKELIACMHLNLTIKVFTLAYVYQETTLFKRRFLANNTLYTHSVRPIMLHYCRLSVVTLAHCEETVTMGHPSETTPVSSLHPWMTLKGYSKVSQPCL